MKVSPSSGCSLQPSTNHSCKIVILYECIEDAIRAQKTYDRIVRNLGGRLPVHTTSWSFALLARPELNSAILRDTALADVIIVAMNGERELPPRIATWVEVSMNGDPEAHPVLIALHADGIEGDATESPLCASLKQIADRRHVSFMCNADFAPRPTPKRWAEPGRNSGAGFIPAREGPFHSPITSERWFGIND
jgi:hypothetical protein